MIESGSSESRPANGRLAGNTLVTAVSLVGTMGLGAVLAVVVLFLFGKTTKTDGLFVAYGIFNGITMVAQSLRTTIVARLVEAPSLWAAFDQYISAVVTLALVLALPLVVLGEPLAHALTGHASGDAHDTARTALWLFAVAGAAQLLAGLGAAALASFERFGAIAVSYLAASVASITGTVVLSGPLDVAAVPVSIAAGWTLCAVLIGRTLMSVGWRLDRRAFDLTGVSGRLWTTVAGAALYATPQAIFVVSLALAARIGSGAATVYTYAFFAASFVVGLSSGSVGIVLAAPVAQGWDRSPASLTPHLRTIVRLGATLTMPVIGVVAIAGDALAAIVLGSKLTESDTHALAGTIVALSGFMLAMLATTVPQLAAFALSRYRAVAAIAVIVVLVHAALSSAVGGADSLELLGVVASVSTTLMLIGLLLVVYGGQAGRPLAAVLGELAPPLAVALVAFGAVGGVKVVASGRASDVALATLGAVAYLLAVRTLLPAHWRLIHRLLDPLTAMWPRPVRRARADDPGDEVVRGAEVHPEPSTEERHRTGVPPGDAVAARRDPAGGA